MFLLAELNDVEVLILKSKSFHFHNEEAKEFWNKHEKALIPPRAAVQSSKAEIEKNTVFQSHKTHLKNLGLLQPKFKRFKKGDFPEFDEKTGMMKAQSDEITSLGRLLLVSIDQLEKQ